MCCLAQIGGAAAIVRQYLMNGFYPTVIVAHISPEAHRAYKRFVFMGVEASEFVFSESTLFLNFSFRGIEILPTPVFHHQAQAWCAFCLYGV
jgi:hypothetical protein